MKLHIMNPHVLDAYVKGCSCISFGYIALQKYKWYLHFGDDTTGLRIMI